MTAEERIERFTRLEGWQAVVATVRIYLDAFGLVAADHRVRWGYAVFGGQTRHGLSTFDVSKRRQRHFD